MRLFSLSLLALVAAIPPDESASSSTKLRLRANGLQSLCPLGPLIQLGLCSPFFVECNGDSVALRKCPIRGEIFSQGVCQPAGEECRDSSISFLIEETQRLADQDGFCASGGGGVYRSFEGCTRQALICSPNGRDVIAVACAKGQILMNDMSCGKGLPECATMQTTPIRDFFLNRLCGIGREQGRNVVKRSIQQKKCDTWFVACSPKPSIVRCESGSVFDESLQYCRPWQQGDNCIMSGSCSGREYQSVSLGHCLSQFLYCDGLHGKYLQCSPGMIFDGNSCASPESAGCPICSPGEKRPSSLCHQYYDCVGGKWESRDCPKGTAFNQESGRCERSYTCATPTNCEYGTVVSISCGKALFCTGNDFEEFSCPQNTRFDPAAKSCVYDPKCNPASCRDGDVITAPDCRTFQICRQGKYSAYYCRDNQGHVAAECRNCGQTNPYNVNQLEFPAQCQENTVRAHQEDCAAYYVCQKGSWKYQRCPEGQEWNAGKCVRPQYGRSCSIAREPQCTEGQRVVNPLNSDCTKVLECRAARWVELQCPKGYYYDQQSKSCQVGSCPATTGPEVIPGHPVPQPPAPPPIDNGYGVQCTGEGRIADQFDCSRYWECRHGQYTNEVCPRGSAFNPRSNSCDSSYQCGAACQEGVQLPLSGCGEYRVCVQGQYRNGKCNLNKAFVDGRCSDKDCGQPGYVPECADGAVQPSAASNDNSVYRTCTGGRWIERKCGHGMVFDWEQMSCIPSTGPVPPPTCYGGETRSSGECSGHYEVCNYNRWEKQTCPYGQIFTNGFCRPGDCGNGNDYCSEGADAYRRDPVDCAKYYQCVHGKWMQRPCAAGTVFNERVSVCDWARNVPECGGTQGGY